MEKNNYLGQVWNLIQQLQNQNIQGSYQRRNRDYNPWISPNSDSKLGGLE